MKPKFTSLVEIIGFNPPSRQKEINRYLSSLKIEASMGRNVEKIIQFLIGKKIKGVIYR